MSDKCGHPDWHGPGLRCPWCEIAALKAEIAEMKAALAEWEACGDRIMQGIGASGPLSDSDVLGELDLLRRHVAAKAEEES